MDVEFFPCVFTSRFVFRDARKAINCIDAAAARLRQKSLDTRDARTRRAENA